jgi:hypothetical protein
MTEDALALAIGRKIQAWAREEPGRVLELQVHVDRAGRPRRLERPKIVRDAIILPLLPVGESIESA